MSSAITYPAEVLNKLPDLAYSWTYLISSSLPPTFTELSSEMIWEMSTKTKIVIFGILKDWKVDTQKLKDELREMYD